VNNRVIGTMDQWQAWPERAKMWSKSLKRFDVHMVVTINRRILWDVTPCSLVD
jgi:hypothetical protein